MTDPSPDRRARIIRAFGRADRYDEAATVQRDVANALARRVAALPLPPRPTVLEIGCGTGFLTEALRDAIGPARWTVSDIAPEMVARAEARLDLEADYRVLDGEHADSALGAFDLICSSLAFQWFGDLPGAVARLGGLLRPGGLLAFSTMARGSFIEWEAACAGEGLVAGTPAYPGQAELAGLIPQGLSGAVELVDYPQPQPDARTFLHRVKAIGAGTPAAGYRPLGAAGLRRAMVRFDAGPRIATYRVGFCLFRKTG